MHPTMICSNMRYWRMRPDPRLRPLVLCYFLARPPNDESLVAATHPADEDELLLPDGHAEIVFTLDGAYERWPLGELQRRHVMRQSYMIGGRSHSVLTRDLGAVTVAGVKLDPRALRSMIRTPLDEFREATLSLRDLGDRALLDLEDAMGARRRATLGAGTNITDHLLTGELTPAGASNGSRRAGLNA
jgi:hypothetical protein